MKCGNYTLVQVIGKGGQSEVWSARSVANEGGPLVAIKIVTGRSEQGRARLAKEIAAVKKLNELNHPNIIQILDSGILSEGTDEAFAGYIVMPMATTTLESVLPATKGRLDLCMELFLELVAAMATVHDQGVIHRDIKPANILFMNDGIRFPVLSDFGICFLRWQTSEERITAVGETVGAKYYMSPEQSRGGPIDVTPAADVYSLGKLLHHMVTGRTLYREDLQHAFQPSEMEREPRLGGLLRDLLSRTIVEDPGERIGNAGQLLIAAKTITSSWRTTGSVDAAGTGGLSDSRREGHCRLATRSALYASRWTGLKRSAKGGFREGNWNLRPELEPDPFEDPRQFEARTGWPPFAHRGELGSVALAVTIAREDEDPLWNDLKRTIERVSRGDEGLTGYESIVRVPHVFAGFLYMLVAVVALRNESWSVLQRVLGDKFEWYFRSGRPLYSYGFTHELFFHADTFGGAASKTHDAFRREMAASEITHATGLRDPELLDAYLQTQMLMS